MREAQVTALGLCFCLASLRETEYLLSWALEDGGALSSSSMTPVIVRKMGGSFFFFFSPSSTTSCGLRGSVGKLETNRACYLPVAYQHRHCGHAHHLPLYPPPLFLSPFSRRALWGCRDSRGVSGIVFVFEYDAHSNAIYAAKCAVERACGSLEEKGEGAVVTNCERHSKNLVPGRRPETIAGRASSTHALCVLATGTGNLREKKKKKKKRQKNLYGKGKEEAEGERKGKEMSVGAGDERSSS